MAERLRAALRASVRGAPRVSVRSALRVSVRAALGAVLRSALLWPLAACCLAALAGCASEAAHRRSELAELMRRLPGEYANHSHPQANVAAPEVGVDLLIAPMRSTVFGDNSFYVRESVADDPRRVLGQRIWLFALNKDGQILQVIYLFKEPQRWLEAVDNPELLLALIPGDLSALSSCTLIWTKTGTEFDGSTKSKSCEPGKKAEGSLVEQAMVLNGDELDITERQTGADGRLLASPDAAALYRFERHGGPAEADSPRKKR
jgi:hypothetical protein